jgi:adenylate cyclase
VRVALNSGRVVVGSIGSPERLKYAVVGDTVNVASRLEGLADPNTIVMGEATHRLLDAEPPREDLGLKQLRGRSQPVRVYRIR